MIYGPQTAQAAALRQSLTGASAARTPVSSGSNAFELAMAGAWDAGGLSALDEMSRAATAAAAPAAGAVSYTDPVSAWGHTDEVPGANLEELLRAVHPQLTYHVMDCSSKNWIRNDFPHYKLFQQNVNKYEIEHWQPTGDEPTQANSPACHKLSQVAPGSVAVVIHPAVQEKMDADPEYAREIFNRIEAWFAFDDARNCAIRAAHGDTGSGIDQRAIAIGEDGMITNALAAGGGELTFSSSGSTGRTKESWWDARLRRHDQLMRETVERQIEHKWAMSQQLSSMSLAAGAKQKVVSMMADPALRAALGDRIGGTPLDTVFDISMQHINNAAAGAFI